MLRIFSIVILFCGFALANSCSQQAETCSAEEVLWGEADGIPVSLFILKNINGMEIRVSNYGATLTYVSVPDKNGDFENVVLGFDSLKNYLNRHPLFGSTIGRFANRIGGAQFILNGTSYQLNGFEGVAMHGGTKGFANQVFEVDSVFANADSAAVVLRYVSPDMEEGYPGTLTTTLTFVLNNNNEVRLEYEAITDKPTVINFTNHSYFNLTGCEKSVLGHIITIMADSITLSDDKLVPTGEIAPVAGTPFDFTSAHTIGERIEEVDPGYDNNYKLRKTGNELSLVAEVYDPESGRLMEAYTTEPGVQFYTGNWLSDNITGHGGRKYGRYFGLCLEMQHFPDSPNKPNFPSTVLNPGEKYRQMTIYKFTVK